MDIKRINTIKKISILILLLSITLLMLTSFLPIIKYKEYTPEEKNIHLNIENMKYYDDPNLIDLREKTNRINLFLWLIILAGFITLLGTIIRVTQKYSFISNSLIMIGSIFTVLVLLITSIYFVNVYNYPFGIKNIEFIYLTGLFKLFYLYLVFLVLLLIASFYLLAANITLIKREHKPKKKTQKTVSQSDITPKPTIKKEEPEKIDEVEEWIKKEMNKDKVTISTKEASEPHNQEEEKTEEKIKEKTEQTTPKEVTPFKNDKNKIDKKVVEKTEAPSHTLEDALSIAIERKQTKKQQHNIQPESSQDKKHEVDTEIEKQKISVEKYNVKCPQCNHTFDIEKNKDGVTKIKCPNCGKEGIIK